ncbi:hypothetical protein EDC04DRAFT_2608606 [Pisolithus marmoratus]|nr:hypothetical protein EDC04DRAFT_2608606 [Pisolithus marmoratus]
MPPPSQLVCLGLCVSFPSSDSSILIGKLPASMPVQCSQAGSFLNARDIKVSLSIIQFWCIPCGVLVIIIQMIGGISMTIVAFWAVPAATVVDPVLTQEHLIGCPSRALSFEQAAYLSVAWGRLLLFDVVVFGLTFWRLVYAQIPGKRNISDMLLWDDTLLRQQLGGKSSVAYDPNGPFGAHQNFSDDDCWGSSSFQKSAVVNLMGQTKWCISVSSLLWEDGTIGDHGCGGMTPAVMSLGSPTGIFTRSDATTPVLPSMSIDPNLKGMVLMYILAKASYKLCHATWTFHKVCAVQQGYKAGTYSTQ